jgi:hypothetical protein
MIAQGFYFMRYNVVYSVDFQRTTRRYIPKDKFLHTLFIYGSIDLLFDLGRFLTFLILYTVDTTSWTVD